MNKLTIDGKDYQLIPLIDEYPKVLMYRTVGFMDNLIYYLCDDGQYRFDRAFLPLESINEKLKSGTIEIYEVAKSETESLTIGDSVKCVLHMNIAAYNIAKFYLHESKIMVYSSLHDIMDNETCAMSYEISKMVKADQVSDCMYTKEQVLKCKFILRSIALNTNSAFFTPAIDKTFKEIFDL